MCTYEGALDYDNSYKASVIVLTDIVVRLDLISYVDSNKKVTVRSVNLPASENPQQLQVTFDSSNFEGDETGFEIRLGHFTSEGTIYTDNFSLKKIIQ